MRAGVPWVWMLRRYRVALEVGALLLLVLVGSSTLSAAAKGRLSSGDEAHYTCTSRYFAYLFLQHDVTGDAWSDDYWTRTQPMLLRYLLGAQLWAHGYDVQAFEPFCDYDFSLTREQNRQLGHAPEREVLATVRAPMLVIAVLALLAIYGLGRALGGMLAGVTAAGLALASPLSQEDLIYAIPEPILILGMMTCALVAMAGMRRAGDGSLPARWAVVTGLVAGLTFAAKLTAVLGLAALGVWGVLVALAAIKRAPAAASRVQRVWLATRAGRGWFLAVAVAMLVFVVSNPYTYPNPIRRTGALFVSRAREMRMQQEQLRFEGAAVGLGPERIGYVLERSLASQTATGSRGAPIEAVLAVAGFAVVLSRAWMTWQGRRRLAPDGLIALMVAAYFVGTMAFLGLDWARYYLPTLSLGCVLSGIATSAAVRRILSSRLPAYRRAPVSEGTGAT